MSGPCPECAGRWLDGLRFHHDPACTLYAADSATIAADHGRTPGTRPATPTELALIGARGYEAPGQGEDYGIAHDHRGGWHDRRVIITNTAGRPLRDAVLTTDTTEETQ